MSNVQLSPLQQATTVGLSLQQTLISHLETVASNLSNGNTSGFKRAYIASESVPTKNGDASTTIYTREKFPKRDFRDGSYHQTDNTFDVAISGTGFFQLENNQLTRNGQFSVNSEGRLVNGSGLAVQGDGGDIIVPLASKFVDISSTGAISTDRGVIGKIAVFNVTDPNALIYGVDGNYTGGAPEIVDNPTVLQGFFEESNVNPVEETFKLMEIMRLFEYTQKLMDDQMKRTSQLLNLSGQNAA